MGRRFGQHFLHERRIVERIVLACELDREDVVFEIGAGPGILTRALAAIGVPVTAVEIDERLVHKLRDERIPNVEVVHADVLTLDLAAIAERAGRKPVVVGNLPYQISSPVLFTLLAARASWSRAVLMLQREVAVRLAAMPGNKDYGVLAARLGAECQVESLFDVAPGCFRPPPAVRSRVVRLRPRDRSRSLAPPELYAAVVRAAFGKRRKTLRNALGELLSGEALQGLGIDPGRRAETLSVEEFDRIARHLVK